MQTTSYYDPAATRTRRPASIAPSISSVLSDATTITAPAHVQRGFKSREAYLAALNEFAESKSYMPAGNYTLQGWYGGETMDERKKREGIEREKRRRSKNALRPDNVNKQRRATIATLPEASEDSTEPSRPDQVGDRESNTENRGKLRRFSRVFASKKERCTSDATGI